MKKCSNCLQFLPLSAFHTHATQGHQGYCKDCRTTVQNAYAATPTGAVATREAARAAYHRKDAQLAAAAQGLGYCGADHMAPLDEFEPDGRTRTGHKNRCRAHDGARVGA